MIIFDNVQLEVLSVLTPSIFYHSNIKVLEDGSKGIYVSSKVELTEKSSYSLLDFKFYFCEVNKSDVLQDVLVPLNGLMVESFVDLGEYKYFGSEGYKVDKSDSGNGLLFDDRYGFLNDLYVPYSSLNGTVWDAGYDYSEDTRLDFLFYYVNPALRELIAFSKGIYVGKFDPDYVSSTVLYPSNILRYISGLFPEDMFLSEEIIKITGIFDNYDTSGIASLFPKNDLELRSFLRSIAVTLGKVSGNILTLKKAIRSLFAPDFTPDSYQMDLNKHFTFRVGESIFNYNPADGKLTFNPLLRSIPFYFTGDNHLLNVTRISVLPEYFLDPDKTYLVYFNLIDQEVVVVEVGSPYVFESIQKALDILTGLKILPLFGVHLNGSREFEKMLFFQTALINSEETPVTKFNALVRSYATKSRSANLFTNLSKEDVAVRLIENVVSQSFAKDTRLFVFLRDFLSAFFVEEEDVFLVDEDESLIEDFDASDNGVYIKEVT